MPAMGTCGDWVFTLGLAKNLKDEDEELDGLCHYDTSKHEATIAINANANGRAALNGWVHETLHLLSIVYGLELSHKAIYAIASGLTQAATSTSLINEYEFEARLRSVAGPPEDLEGKK